MKQILEQAIREMEAKRDAELRVIEQRIMQEKILPFNREIDEARDKALQQLAAEYNESVKALQEKFDKDKNDIILASEQHKKEKADGLISAEAGSLVAEYGMMIAEVQRSLDKIKE